MVKKKIYLSGPISGLDYKEAKKRFHELQEMLEKKGHDVFNPIEYCESWYGPDDKKEWQEYMNRLLPCICRCDTIYMMNGWKESYGAQIEYLWAVRCGLEVVSEEFTSASDQFSEPNYFRKLYHREKIIVDYLKHELNNMKIYLAAACIIASFSTSVLIGMLVKHLLR